jgi:hypothetical protein
LVAIEHTARKFCLAVVSREREKNTASSEKRKDYFSGSEKNPQTAAIIRKTPLFSLTKRKFFPL